jgi:PAS domain S-box-containing protein
MAWALGRKLFQRCHNKTASARDPDSDESSVKMAAQSEARPRHLWSRPWLRLQASLSTKMAAIVIIGVIALMGLFAYLGEAALNESIQHSLQDRVVLAEATARHIDYALDNVEYELTRTAQLPALTDPTRRDAALQSVYSQLNFFGLQVFIIDRAGTVVAAYPPITDTISLADLRSVQEVLQGQSFAVSRAAHSLNTAVQSPVAVAPLRDTWNQIVGALGVSIALNSPRLRVFTVPVELGDTGYMDLVDPDGVILASTRPERVGESSDHDQAIVKMIQADRPVVSRCHNCHTATAQPAPRPEVMAFAPLDRVPWGVMVRQDEAEVMAAARDLQARIFTLGAIALLGALLLVYLTTRSVIMPVQELTRAAQRIAGGDLQTPIREYGKDEIGVLARAFDTMRSRLQSSIAEIQTWNRELDARVRDRTRALADAQWELQQSRDRLQAIIDSLSDELLVIDRDYRVTRVNAAVQRRHGDAASLIGAHCYAVVHNDHPCALPDCECPLPRVIETGQPVRVTHSHRNSASVKTRYLEVVTAPLDDSLGSVGSVVELWRDVTEEREMQEMILQRNRELLAVNAIARVLEQSLRLDECLRLALNEVRQITRLDVGAVFLVEGADNHLQLHSCYGMPREVAETAYRFGLSDTACGGVLEIGKTIVVQDLPPGTKDSLDRPQRESLASLVHVPLVAKGKPLGTLCLGTRTPRVFSEEELSLLGAVGSQIAAAVEIARLYEELSRKEQLRGELLRRVISAQEDERRRIARELHDETSQTLSALRYTLDAAAKNCLTPDTSPLIDQVRQLTVNAMDGINKIIFDLRPTVLDHLGLVAALRRYATTRLGESGIRVELSEPRQAKRLPATVETALFRSAQEAINNIAHHAGARRVWIDLDFQNEQVEIRVKDDGIGFDVNQVADSANLRSGLGLLGMQERMSEVGGEFSLVSAPGEGTTVFLRVPTTGGDNGSN